MSDEEKGYEVKDKRKVTLDEHGDAQINPETSDEGPTEEDLENYRKMMADLPPVDIMNLLRSFIQVLTNQTWVWLGLIKNPVTGNLEKDLNQAKVAIDTVSLLAGQMEGKIDESEFRMLQGLLSDLRINFVQQSAKQD